MIEILVQQGDITKIRVDAIVNAANQRLLGGGGVDGAIHRAGGPQIMVECDRIRAEQSGCKAGQAVMTTAGDLPAQAVFHTVGPIWHDGENNESELLAQCYRNCLAMADENGFTSISFPNISTGVYGYPRHLAAPVAINAVRSYLNRCESCIEQVIFVCFDEDNTRIYQRLT